MNWNDGIAHCQNLDLGGTGWRLPNISELRSLIRNCGPIETGGACGVVDVCGPCSTETACLSYSTCWTDANCNPSSCTDDGGPTGCYWPTELTGTCWYYWSSSESADFPNSAWFVSFDIGNLYFDNMDLYKYFRCVR